MNNASYKVVALLSSKVDVSASFNVVGHLAIAIGFNGGRTLIPSTNLVDRSGVDHLGVSAWPLIVLKTRPSKLGAALAEARRAPDVLVADFPCEMLTTVTDDELVLELAAKEENELEYLGLMAYGPTSTMDRLFGSFSLWSM